MEDKKFDLVAHARVADSNNGCKSLGDDAPNAHSEYTYSNVGVSVFR